MATVWEIVVEPYGANDLTVIVQANKTLDLDENPGPPSPVSVTAVWDADGPLLAVEGVPKRINSVAALPVTFMFSESVTGFAAGDVTVANGALTGLTEKTAGTVWTATVTPNGQGDLRVSVAKDSVTDNGSNDGPATAVVKTATYDATAPGLAIGGVPEKINSTAPVTATFTFDEAVRGFAAGDVTAANGALSDFAETTTGTVWTATVTPDGAGDLTVRARAGAAQDGHDNPGPAAGVRATATFDATPPGLAIEGLPARINSIAALTATFTFDEAVTGFAADDVTVTHGALSSFTETTAGRIWRATVTPDGGGDLTVAVKARAAADGHGNAGPATAVRATATYDADAPTVTIGGVPEKINSTAALTATFTFSEAVTGFESGDVTVTNGALTGLAEDTGEADDTVWTATVTPDGAGDLTVTVGADTVTDGHGNMGPASDVAKTASYDADAPAVDIGGVPATINSATALTASFTFDEAVTGFESGDVMVTNGALTGLGKDTNAAVADTVWTATVTPDGAGDLTVRVKTGAVEDSYGNAGPAAAVHVTATWDADAPRVLVTGLPATIGNTGALAVKFTFSEAVTGFESDDVTVTNGALTGLGKDTNAAVADTVWTATVTPDGAGDLTVTVRAEAVTDSATNAGPATAAAATAVYNVAPAFTSASEFEVAENTTAVATVAAADADSADSVTGYVITGGADRARFSIDSSTGALVFRTAPNFEAPADVESTTPANAAGNNEYVVLVSATGGTESRSLVAVQPLVVTVTDDDTEAPGVPEAPAVAAASPTSLTATWTEPDNPGPAITDYDYRYRTTSPQGSWTEVTGTTSTARTATIASLAEGTGYDVQVRATNAEGTGAWSAEGSGSTTSKPKVTLVLGKARIDESGSSNGTTLKATLPWAVASATVVTVTANPSGAVALGSPGTLTIAPNAIESGTLTVTAVDNAVDADDAEVTLSGTVDNAAVAAPDAVTLTVADDDVTGPTHYGLSVSPSTLKDTDFTGSPMTREITLTLSGSDGDGDSLKWAGAESDGTLHGRGVFQREGVETGDYLATTKGLGYFTLSGAPSGLTITKVRQEDNTGDRPAYVTLSLSGILAQASYTVTIAVNHNVLSFEDGSGSCSNIGGGNAFNAAVCPASLSTTFTLAREAAKPLQFVAAGGDGQVELSWADPGRSGIINWQYRQKPKSSSESGYSAWKDVPGSTATTTTWTVPNLANGTQYTFQVRAVNAVGAGAQSDEASATPAVAVKPKVSLVLGKTRIDESGSGNATTVKATLASAVPSQTTVTVSVSPPGKVALVGGTLTIAANTKESATVAIVATDNAVDADDAEVTVSGMVDNTAVDAPDAVTLTVTDDDDPPALSIANATLEEAAAEMSFAVTLDAASGKEVSVSYATSNGTATAGADYTAGSGTLTFAAGDTGKSVAVAVLEDALDEADETFTVTLSSPSNATLAGAEATGTITDDDALPALSVDSPSVAEGDSGTATLTFTVTLSAASGRRVTVDYADAGTGTATSGADYTAVTATTLTFAPGDTGKTVDVTVSGDMVDEANETVVLRLSNAASATLATGTGTGTITDDDTRGITVSPTSVTVTEANGAGNTATYTVKLDSEPTGDVTVTPTSGDTGVATVDPSSLIFTASTWNTAQTVTVNGVDDTTVAERSTTISHAVSGGDYASVTAASVSVTLTDDDTANAPPDLTVGPVLPGGAAKSKSVAVTVADTDAGNVLTAAYKLLSGATCSASTYGSTAGTAVTLAETPASDGNTQQGSVTLAAESANGKYVCVKAGDGTVSVYEASAQITGIDTTAPTVTAGSTGYYSNAGLTTALSGPQKSGADIYTKVTFSEDMKHVKSDTATARPELFHRIGTTDTQYDILDNGGTLASGDCKPNDATDTDVYVCLYTVGGSDNGAFTVKAGTNSVDKADNALASAYTHAASVTLDTEAPMIAFPSGVAPRVGTASTVTLTDATAKVAKYGIVEVAGAATDATGCDDPSAGGDNFTTTAVSPLASSKNVAYTPMTAGKKVCVYAEDAAGNSASALWATAIAGPSFSASAASVAEGDSGEADLQFTVTLSPAASADTTVDWATSRESGDTATPGTDYTAGNGTLTFTAGDTSKTVTVKVTGDAIDEDDETLTLTLSNATGGAGVGTATATGTITDDDALPALSIDSPSVTEGDSGTATLTFTATLSAASGRRVTVDYADAGTGTATSGADYTAVAGGTLTFAAGDTSESVDVTVSGDMVDEANETVVLRLSNAASATLATASGTGTIVNDDDAATVPANYGLSVSPTAFKDTDFAGRPRTKEVTLTLSGSDDGTPLTWAGATQDGSLNKRGVLRRVRPNSGDYFATTRGLGYFTLSGAPSGLTITKVRQTAGEGVRPAYVTLSLSGSLAQASYTVTITVDHNVLSFEDSAGTCSDIAGTGKSGTENGYDPNVCPASLSTTFTLTKATTDTTAPTVTAGSTGYFSDAALTSALSGPQKSGADIYTKVTFSEDMKHVKGDGASARPELFHRIGTTDARYDMLDNGDTLANGDCKPNDATDTDVYVCLYTVGGSDNGAFTVKAGTSSVDRADNALASAYTHAASLTLDTADPTIAFPTGETPTVGTAATITLTDTTAKVAKYGIVEVAGTATDAIGCDDPSGDSFSTTAVSPVASPKEVSHTPVTAGKKVCVYAEDAAGNSASALWATAIAAANAAPDLTVGPVLPAGAAKSKSVAVTVADGDADDALTAEYKLLSGATCDATAYGNDAGTAVTLADTAADDGNTKEGSVSLAAESANDKYVCVKAGDGTASVYKASARITGIDTTAPTISAGTPDLAAADDTGLDTDNITKNTADLTVSGTLSGDAATGDFVQLYNDGAAIAGATDSAFDGAQSRNWSIDIALAEGVHSITAAVVDAVNNAGVVSSALSITVDATAPDKPTGLTLKTPGSSSGTVAAPTITVTLAESGGTAQLFSDSGCSTAASAETAVVSGASTVDIAANAQSAGAAVVYHAKHTDAATNASDCSTETVSYTYTLTAPSQPTGLGATASGRTQIDLSWTAPAEDTARAAATGYKVESGTSATGPWTALTTITGAATVSHSDTGLAPSTTRHYRVRATSSAGDGAWSATASATTAANNLPVFSPNAVTRTVAENAAEDTNVGAVIAAATDDDSDTLTYTFGGPDEASFDFNATTRQITVKSGTALNFEGAKKSYTVTVTAADAYGSGTVTVTINVTDVDEPPGKPDTPTVGSTTTDSVTVNWTAPPNTGPAITDYDVQYRKGSTGPWSDHSHTGTAVTATITGLDANSAYQVQVRATNAEGTGAWSDAVTGNTGALTAPSQPTGLGATPGGRTQIDLSWTAPAAATGKAAATGYKVESGTSATGPWTALTTISDPTTVSHSHTGLAPSTTRHYRVRATSSAGDGAWSATASATTAANNLPAFTPNAVTRTVAENAAEDTNVGAVIAAATDDDSDSLTYTFGGTDEAAFDFDATSRQITVKSGTVLNFEGAKKSYTVTVSAADAYGSGTVTVTINVTDVDEPPGKPDAPTVGSTTTDSVTVNWTAPSNTGPAITDYDVQYRKGTSGPWSAHDHTGTAVTATIGSLDANSAYQVQVRATNAEGTGAWSEPVTGMTGALTAPSQPTGLGATASGRTQIDLSWTAPAAATGKAAATGYKVESGTSATGPWTALTTITDPTTVSHSHTGLAPSTMRHYRVRATSSAGDGAWSATASATTAANNLPAFSPNAVTRTVAENAAEDTNVGAVIAAATDDDSDSLTYTFGGPDEASFDFNATTRQITVKSGTALNFEGAKKSYTVTVSAADAYGSGTVTVTINVTDVAEPPGKPSPPTVGSTTTSSVTVNWTAPSNTGPAITDYDVQYRKGTAGPWSDHAHTGTAVTATIGSLDAGSGYQVQVRATNDEGTGAWSEAVTGSTAAKPKVTLVLGASSIAESGSGNATTVKATLPSAVSSDTVVTLGQSPAGKVAFGSPTVTIPANMLESPTVTVTAVDNKVDAANASVAISGAAGGTAVTAPDNVTLTVTDDDTRGVTVSETGVTVTEASGSGNTATYTVKLDSQPTGDVTVTLTSGDTGVATVNPSSLTFTASNWSTAQTVTVTGVDDTTDAERSTTITHAVSGGDYGSVTAASVSVTLTDDDTAAPTVSSVALTSSVPDGQNGHYRIGDTVTATVTFNANVNVTGKPRLELQVGSNARRAVYTGGSGTMALTFDYTVREGDADSDGIAIGANKLTLPGSATIKETTGVSDANRNFSAVGANALAKVDGVRPTVTGITFEAAVSGKGPVFNASSGNIRVIVAFSEAISVSGTPTFAIRVGANSRTLTYASGVQDSHSARFEYSVQANEEDLDGVSANANSLTVPNNASIRDVAGNAATKTHNALDAQSNFKVDSKLPIAPTGLTATGGHEQVTLRWDDPGDESIARWQVKQDAGSWTDITPSNKDTVMHTVTGLTNGTSYSFRVRAVDIGANDGGQSDAKSATPQEIQVTGLAVRALSWDGLEVTWDALEEASSYWVQWKSAGQEYHRGRQKFFRVATHARIGGLRVDPKGTEYTVRVLANGFGLPNGGKGQSAEVTAMLSPVRAEAVDGGYELRWEAMDHAKQSGYRVKWGLKGSDEDGWRQARVNRFRSTPRYTLYGLEAGATYEVKVSGIALYYGQADIPIGGTEVAVPGGGNHERGVPGMSAGAVSGEVMRLDFDAPLQGSSAPPSSAFAVTAGASRRGVAGVAVEGRTVTLRLSGPVGAGDAVTVGYAPPAGSGQLRSASGGAAQGFADRAVENETPPSVVSVTVAPAPAGGWAPGARVEASVRFDAPVRVGLSGGTPTLGLMVGGARRAALYDRGSGTAVLSFVYTATQADAGAAWARAVSNGLSAGGGVIAGVSDVAAVLGFASLPALSAADAHAAEGESLAFRVTLDAAASGPVTVDWATADGTARAGADYEGASGTLTFAVGETAKTVEVAALADAQDEGAETLALTLSNPTGAVLGRAGASGSIADVALAPPPVALLTAHVAAAPSEHGGKEAFAVQIAFSAALAERTGKALRGHALSADGGAVRDVQRVDGRRDLWSVRLRPDGIGAVTLRLAASSGDCASAGAICSADGRALADGLSHTVPGPAALSVADARATEGVDAAIDFAVTLDRAAAGEVTVRYATHDGTAKAGEDYRRARGKLTFAVGETEKTVSVELLDDAHDEGGETFTLVLSRARGAVIADGEAVGTIENSDPMPQAWLARFGRTVGGHVTDAIGARFEVGTGGGGNHVTLGGQRVSLDAAQAGTDGERDRDGWMRGEGRAVESRTMTGRELLLGSAFHLALTNAGEAAGDDLARWTAWGRAAASRFDGEADGLALDGDVTTVTVGADAARERWLAGVAVSLSEGEGSFRDHADTDHEGRGTGTLESSLASVHPYVRYEASERLSLWGILGYGAGGLDLEVEGSGGWTTDTTMGMAAAGARAVLVPASGGFALAARTDAQLVRMTSQAAAGNLAASESHTSRVRLVLEGSRAFALDGGGALTPSLEVGLRHDGGDAETGAGIEMGGGVRWAAPALGLTADAKVRALVAHEEAAYDEWGANAAVRIEPDASGRGLSLGLDTARGADSGGAERMWSLEDARGLAAEDGAAPPGNRLAAELGYGFAVLGGRAVATPHAGWSRSGEGETLRLGQRLTLGASQWSLETALEEEHRRVGVRYGYRPGDVLDLSIEAGRREPAAGDGASEHELTLHIRMRW